AWLPPATRQCAYPVRCDRSGRMRVARVRERRSRRGSGLLLPAGEARGRRGTRRDSKKYSCAARRSCWSCRVRATCRTRDAAATTSAHGGVRLGQTPAPAGVGQNGAVALAQKISMLATLRIAYEAHCGRIATGQAAAQIARGRVLLRERPQLLPQPQGVRNSCGVLHPPPPLPCGISDLRTVYRWIPFPF